MKESWRNACRRKRNSATALIQKHPKKLPPCKRCLEFGSIFKQKRSAKKTTHRAKQFNSIKTAQALLGHSDLGTTLNTYAHVIPDSQRRAVEGVAKVLFSNVLEMKENAPSRKNQLIANAALKN